MIESVSIRRKQILVVMLTSTVALLLACGAFIAYERISFQRSVTDKLNSLAVIIGNASATALEFNDPKAADEVLMGLRQERHITAAVIYNANGDPFAVYTRPVPGRKFTTPLPTADSHEVKSDSLAVFRRITVKGARLGTVYIESNLHELSERLVQYVKIVSIVLLAALGAALLLSARLQRVIADPILALARTAKKISTEKNYTLRVPTTGPQDLRPKDELRELTTIFNEMLDQIQAQDAALRRTHDDLEERVRARTAELQQQLTRIDLLNSITRAIAARQDLESVVSVVLRELEEHLPIHFGEVLLYDPQTQTVSPARHGTAYYRREGAFSSNTAVSAAGLERCLQGHIVIGDAADTSDSPLFKRMAELGMRAFAAVPLMIEGELFGVMLVARNHKDAAPSASVPPAAGAFSAGECEFLRMLSEQVALAAHQARLHTQLQRAYDELRQTQLAIMQEERLRALGQMASGIAHDINNALCPIVVYSDLMLGTEKGLSDAGLKNLQNIKTSGEDIAHIVSRMREFYRRRDDRDSHLPIDLNRIATQVIDLTRPRWRDIPQARGLVIELRSELGENLPEVVASESEVREAITNLILNAVDAMPNGGELTLRTKCWGNDSRRSRGPREGASSQRSTRDARHSHVILEVVDTGTGMDEDTRKRCLEPFFSTKGKRGTGLGLAMVYGIMERHEGNIEIESQLGKGTIMRLIFPLRPIPARTPAVTPTPTRLPSLRVLCIDDEPLLRELLQQLLENGGHTVEVADSGQTGLDLFRNARQRGQPFDLVITDLGMPHLDGRQVAKILKAESVPDRKVPIIMLTGWGTMMKDDGDLPTQVDGILTKPPRIRELFEMMARVTRPEGSATDPGAKPIMN